MNDREMLEYAAKAAGIVAYYPYGKEGGIFVRFDGPWRLRDTSDLHGALKAWSPLTDDGDALRLAVTCWVDLVHFSEAVRADVDGLPDVHEKRGNDPCAATRRAIVRAAAEIGRAMP